MHPMDQSVSYLCVPCAPQYFLPGLCCLCSTFDGFQVHHSCFNTHFLYVFALSLRLLLQQADNTTRICAQLMDEAVLTGCVLPAEVSPQQAAPAQAAGSQPAQPLLGACQVQETTPDGFHQLAGAAMQAVRAAEWAVERAVRTSPSRWGQSLNRRATAGHSQMCLPAHCKLRLCGHCDKDGQQWM